MAESKLSTSYETRAIESQEPLGGPWIISMTGISKLAGLKKQTSHKRRTAVCPKQFVTDQRDVKRAEGCDICADVADTLEKVITVTLGEMFTPISAPTPVPYEIKFREGEHTETYV
ncbi:MAG: hypothetical protein CVU43_07080 [Chloroflexi bacterium HGW-Chloroflexi-5]|nr:MAG: hypothetical protein CVU43_07080 [Chloroflexi bacterium HGW-Chloroflexi-5]